MPLQISGQVGPAILADGAGAPLRQGRTGESIVTELHGRYYEAAYRKSIFTAYAAAQATSLVGTGMVGLQLWNGSPVVSGVNLVILKVGAFIIASSATQTGVVLATGVGQIIAPTGQTAATRVANNFIGGPPPQALATNAATFTNAPTAFLTLLHNTAAINTVGVDAGGINDLEGSVIVPPQCYICFAALGAAGAASSNQLHIKWEEVPV